MSHSHAHQGEAHLVPLKVYWIILAILVVLTVVTVLAAYQDFGNFNLVIAMLIASIKALIVALFFMHLKYEHPLTWLYAAFPIVLLGLLLAGVFIDIPLRDSPQPLHPIASVAASEKAPASHHQ